MDKVFFLSIFFYCLYSIHFKFLKELDDFWNHPTHSSKFYKNLDRSWLRKRAKSTLLTNKEELFSHINTKSINMETFRLKVGWSSYLIIAWKIHFFSISFFYQLRFGFFLRITSFIVMESFPVTTENNWFPVCV